MAFVHSKDSRLFMGKKHISGSVKGFSSSWSQSLGETTSLSDSGSKFIPGLTEGSVSVDGMFEQDAVNEAIHETIQNAIGVDNGMIVSALPAGITLGYPTFFAQTDISSYEVESGVDDIVSLSMEAQGDGGVDWGYVLHAHNAVTATGQDTSVDNTAGTTNGGVAALHVTTVSGTSPSATIKVQHSTDNSTWADLITFTAATAATSEYKSVTGTVNRYVRAQYTITGTTPSFTFLLAFARR